MDFRKWLASFLPFGCILVLFSLMCFLVELRITYLPVQLYQLRSTQLIPVSTICKNCSNTPEITSVIKTVHLESAVSPISFTTVMSLFDWNGYTSTMKSGTNERNRTEIKKIIKYQESLILLLTQFVTMEPKISVNTSCKAPILTPHSEIQCQGHGNAFKGSVRTVVRKVGILVQFGFDVDVLEIYLNEIYDVVDRFFIIESTKAHFRTVRKELIWEKVKNQPRFLKFRDKMIHFIIDDAESAKASELFENSNYIVDNKKIWRMESIQESLRWKKFIEWNQAHLFFSPDDLIGFGDSDEIPNREMVHLLKHCELNAQKVDFGIWFPFGNIKFAYASDYPVPGHKYTLGDPTFWTVRSAIRYSQQTQKFPGRMRGTSGKFILGGIHMTHYGYLPYQLIRRIACTECSPYSTTQIANLVRHLENNEIRKLEVDYGAIYKDNMARIVNITYIAKEMEDIAILPWFYGCNRNRYPVFEEGHDTRLD